LHAKVRYFLLIEEEEPAQRRSDEDQEDATTISPPLPLDPLFYRRVDGNHGGDGDDEAITNTISGILILKWQNFGNR
jgi:hypothetical protein